MYRELSMETVTVDGVQDRMAVRVYDPKLHDYHISVLTDSCNTSDTGVITKMLHTCWCFQHLSLL